MKMQYYIEISGAGDYRAWYRTGLFWHKLGTWEFNGRLGRFTHTRYPALSSINRDLEIIKQKLIHSKNISSWKELCRGVL